MVLGLVFQWHVGSPGPGIKLASPALATREALQQLFMPKSSQVAKNLPANTGDVRHLDLIPGLGNNANIYAKSPMGSQRVEHD